ncbi:YybH family protein [Metasolibacillus fluoroglycofenilyticus]|uniref:YybH family protein n=1 Tax=Metasolibacillus fluoroglycofenilyticus TaxID=1239396 RepID=UPI000D368C9B|nr:nuclear transport factor 2 family protein [Metasolibacillus fluoroglycofenilyticus]
MNNLYEQALNDYISATNTHDFTNVQRMLHPNVVYWFTDKKCTTMTEIQHYFENAWEAIKEEIYEARDVQWLITNQDTATCLYTYCYSGYYNGKFVSGQGRATNIFVKNKKNEWKLIHEHLSSGL